jgi:tRNA(fMet)-specific endonuclease VapC
VRPAATREIRYGLRRAGRSALPEGFEAMVQVTTVLPFAAAAADHAAAIRIDLESRVAPVGPRGLPIAATARRHGCVLVKDNTRKFSGVPGLELDDWY